MKLFLIRHGKPNIENYSGYPGPPLSEIGLNQAKSISNILVNEDVGQIFQSDYIRVLETSKRFIEISGIQNITVSKELREREKKIETHEGLVKRVQHWFKDNSQIIFSKNTAMFSHCGPINMILEIFDPKQELITYPYEDEYFCRTPLGGIWELNFEAAQLINARLIYNGDIIKKL